MNKKQLILYWADYCPYCHEYLPEWKNLKKKLEKLNIQTKDYEKKRDWDIVSKENIETFPTLKYVDENGKKIKLKKRDTEYILDFIKKKQKGGGNNYFYKYLKYKNKYLNLNKLI
tara:strand:+ start:7925 stop:8269 length:345 start_codon:yes stop_codon:yes gene_type:complete